MIRIVKMEFKTGKEEEFLSIFHANKGKIANWPGCTALELLRDKDDPSVFFTYSIWNSEADLLSYRNSELFKEVWSKVSPHFRCEAKAWSTENLSPDF